MLSLCKEAKSEQGLQLADFICEVGNMYKEDRRPVAFVLTLLREYHFLLVNMESEDALEMKTKFMKYFNEYIGYKCPRIQLIPNVNNMIVSQSLENFKIILSIIISFLEYHFQAAEK